MRRRTVAGMMRRLLMVGLCGALPGLAATAPAKKAPASYDFSQHFREPLVLVQDGKPTATIVVATSATRTVQFAVSELNRHLKLSTGTELPVVEDGTAVAGPTSRSGAHR